MAATELATAYISLVPSMRGAQGAIARELSNVDADGIGRGIGSKMGGGISGTLKGLVGPALAGLAAIGFGGYIAEAARASDATDKFKSTMNFAGLDTSAVAAATKASKDYADQTVYDLSDIQKTMATLAANGVKDFTGITTAAGNLNAVAGGNAETFKSVSLALGQSAGAGKLMAEDWNMLADAIPGASGMLRDSMKEAGAYTGDFKKAMENGDITAQEFQDAITKLGSDPVAVEAARSVTTFEGALGNLEATINSGLMGALDAIKPMLTGAINGVATGIGAAFDYAGTAASGLKSLLVDGDYTGAMAEAFGLQEDSPAVGFMFAARDTVAAGVPAIWNLLAHGDFTGGMSYAFGLEEDSPAVGFMLRARDVVAEGIPAIWTLLSTGDFTGGMSTAFGLEEDSPAVDFMYRAMDAVGDGLDGIKDLWAGFTLPMDALTGAGVDMSGLVGVGAAVRETFDSIWAAVLPMIPTFVDLWAALSPVGTLFQVIQPFIGDLVGVVVQLAGVLGSSLMTAITGLLPSLQLLQSTAVSLFQGVLAAVLPVVVQLVTMLGATFAQLLPVLIPIITQVATLAATLVSQLAPIFMELVSAVLPMVVSILGVVLAALAPLISTIASILIPIIQALMPIVVTVFSVIADVITNAMQIVQGIIQVVTGIISGNWSQVFSGLLNIASGVFGLILSVISGAIQLVASVVGNGLNAVFGFFSSIFSGIVSYVSNSWASLVNGTGSMLASLLGFFSGLAGKITGAMGDVGRTLWDTGVNIIQGLINGISSMMGAIGRAVLSIVPEAIRGPFEDLLGIHSPSRVAVWWGHMIGDGLIGGLEDMYDPVAEATALLMAAPPVPEFATAGARASYAAAGTYPASAGHTGPLVEQNVYPRENMSEENVANMSARKIVGALT